MMGRIRALYSKAKGEKRQVRDKYHRSRRARLELLEPRVVLSADLDFAFDIPMPLGGNELDEHVHEPDLHVLSTDMFGNPFYSEPEVVLAASGGGAAAAAGDDTLWQGFNLGETFSLHSRPTANHVIYLDFNGHVTSGTFWNTAFANGADIITTPWSSDADDTSFTDSEKALIQRVWARVSEDYAPFDVDVTTEEPLLADLMKSSGTDTKWGSRVVIGPNTWFSPAGGVAYVGSFTWDSDTPCFVFNTAENGIAESSSHEAGHTLGLSHDGNLSTAYDPGHGSGMTSWGPIMGAPYNRTLTQWSKGEYLNANNPEDDLAIISTNNGFGYRVDDYGDVFAEATPLLAGGAIQIDASYGVIEQSTDYDMFSFQAGAGAASISIDTLAIGPNLDVLAELYNSTGALIASSNPVDEIGADFSLSLPVAGTYFLRISGTGKGDPLGDGYTDYGSLGNYRITGTVPAYSPGNAVPVATDDQATTTTGATVVVDVLANDSDGDNDPLTVLSVTQGSHGAVMINPDNTVSYTPNAGFIGQDDFTYTVSDIHGAQDTAQVTILVTGGVVLINGGFEIGLSGWETSGHVLARTSTFGETPAEGQYQAVLTNINSFGGNVTLADLQTFLGIGAGTLDGIAPGTATAGSAMRQSVTVAAGQGLTFQYNFVTNESTPDVNYNDFSFFTVSGSGIAEALLLADTAASGFGPSGSIYKESTGYREFTYTFVQGGVYTIGFGISDSKDTSYDSVLLIDAVSTGESSNTPPVAVNDNAQTAEDNATTIDVTANDTDADGDLLDVIGVTQGSSGSIVLNANDTLTYTPNANFNGNDTFTYTISDGNGGQAVGTVAVTVTPQNDPPVATIDGKTTLEDNAVTINVLANDTDIDGDVLDVISVSQGTSGSIVLNANNTVTYTPHADVNGNDTFTYTISDGNGGQATGAVNVTVTPQNDMPVAGDDASNTSQDTPVTIVVLDNDTDVDGDTLTVASLTQPLLGSAAINGDSSITYTPAAGFSGNITFSYAVSDGHGGQATANVAVTVTPTGTPNLVNGGFEQGLTGWETRGDVSTRTAAFGETPVAGTYQGALTNTNTAGGNVTIADLEAFLGIGGGTLDAVVVGTATAGSAIRQTVTVQAGTQLTLQYNFVTNESTPDSNYNDFSFFTVSGPGTAVAMLLADTQASGFASSASIYKESTGFNSYSYTFATAGQYTIGFGVSDSKDTSYDSALLLDEVSIGGTSPNTPPTAVADNRTVDEDHAVVVDVLANDSDPDGHALSVTAATQGNSGSVVLNANDTATYTPNADFHGTDTFTYTITDGHGGQATATVTVIVTSVNDGPIALDDTAATDQNLPVTIHVLSNDSDIDGGTLNVQSVTGSRNGTVIVNGDNTVTYTPGTGYVGQDSFSYTIADGQGGQATASVTVTVRAPASNVLNGGFELDLMYWEAIGDASAVTNGIGEAPVAGSKQGVITTANTHGGNIAVADLEMFLGLPSGAVNGVTVGTATAGSALRQTMTVPAGVELAFSYNFLTNENTPDANYNDFSFFSVVGPGVQTAFLLADSYASQFSSSASAYKESTGYLTFTYSFPQAGQYSIGFGVSDARDTSYDSALLVDRVALQPLAAPLAAATFDPAGSGDDDAPVVPTGNSTGVDTPENVSSAGNSGSQQTAGKTGKQPQKYNDWLFGFTFVKGVQAESDKPDSSDAEGVTNTWYDLVDLVLAGW